MITSSNMCGLKLVLQDQVTIVAIEVWEWIYDSTPLFIGHGIIYPHRH